MKVLFGDAIVFSQASFCLTPEVFDAVNVVDFGFRKMGAVIDTMMVKS